MVAYERRSASMHNERPDPFTIPSRGTVFEKARSGFLAPQHARRTETGRHGQVARPLRIEFENALYHVIARGNARERIFLTRRDRLFFLSNLLHVAERRDWRIWAWCLMDNHYHVLVQTLSPTLSSGMREVNGVYAQAFNRWNDRVGHVLQGRFKSILVEDESYLLELSRYIVLNPVRAGTVTSAGEWPWSSYRAIMGMARAPRRLAVAETLALFSPIPQKARSAYAEFVGAGMADPDSVVSLPRSCILGSPDFVERLAETTLNRPISPEVPRKARPAVSLTSLERKVGARNEAIREAFRCGVYTLSEIADHFGLHYTTVSKIARRKLDP